MNRIKIHRGPAVFITVFCIAMAGAVPLDAALEWTVYTDASELRSISLTGTSVWAAGRGGLVRLDRSSEALDFVTTGEGLPQNELNVVLARDDEELWIGTAGAGLLRYRPQDTEPWVRIRTFPQGLAADRVQCLVDGPDGEIWYGTNSGFGVMDGIVPGAVWTVLNGLESEDIAALAFSADTLFVGTGAGLVRLDPDGSLGTEMALGTRVDAIVAGSESLWFISDGAIMRRPLAGGAWTELELPLAGHAAQAMVAVSGYLHFSLTQVPDTAGQFDRIYRYDPAGDSWTDLSAGLPQFRPLKFHLPDYLTMAVEGEELWIGGVSFNGTGPGLLRRDDESWTQFALDDRPLGPEITAMYLGPSGRLGQASTAGYAWLEDGAWHRKYPDADLAVQFGNDLYPQPYVSLSAMEDQEGWIYFFSWSRQLARWHPGTDTQEILSEDQQRYFIGAAEDAVGNRWFISDTYWPDAIDILDASEQWHGLGLEENLPGTAVDDIAFLPDDRVALLFRGVGLQIWDTNGTLFEFADDQWFAPSNSNMNGVIYDPLHLLDGDTQGFSIDTDSDGGIWVGQGDGVVRVIFEGERYRVIGKLGVATLVSPGMMLAQTRDVAAADDGSVWVATGLGLSHVELIVEENSRIWNVENWSTVTGRELAGPEIFGPDIVSPLPHREVRKLALSPDGETLYVGTANGIARARIEPDPLPPPEAVSEAWFYPNPVRVGEGLHPASVKLGGVESEVEITIYNLEGEIVLPAQNFSAGDEVWDFYTPGNRDFATSGVYLARIVDRGAVSVKRIVLIR